MSKKLLLSLAPLLAVAAFAIAPAAASAATTYGTCAPGVHSANCPVGDKFTAFPAGEKVNVVSFKAPGTGNFILENVTKTADIDCSSLVKQGHVENVGGIGKSLLKVAFDECKGSGELAACTINSPTEAIVGSVSDEVKTATTVEITIVTGFNVKCRVGAEEIELGNVTGKVTGTQANATNILTFSKAGGLTFLGAGLTITGSDILYTEVGLKPVYI
jgi:hypothetical protein